MWPWGARHQNWLTRACLAIWALATASPTAGQMNVLTYQYDNTRAGSNLHEKILTPRNVISTRFGKLFQHVVDGSVYAQPLYLSNVQIEGKGNHNVVYVATEHDSVYAFDADDDSSANAAPLWHVSFSDPAKGVSAVPAHDYLRCPAIVPEIGITSTPVIDPAAGTLYVVAMTKEGTSGPPAYVHRLHALDVASGRERPGSPVKIEAAVPGSGDGGDRVVFNPRTQKQRPGLLLLNGVVYSAWSSQCERLGPYHGWVLGYDSKTLQQLTVFNSTPNGTEGSFWESGVAPAADDAGNIFVVSGNGSSDRANGGADLGQSYIELSTRPDLRFKDYFTPFNVARLNRHDVDLGSSGVVLLPDDIGSRSHPHLMIGSGKEGRVYLLDRDHMGGHNPASDSQIVQSIEGAVNSVFGKPAYFNRSIYFCGSYDRLKRFSIVQGRMGEQPASESSLQFDYPGCVPTVSADTTDDGIVWVLESSGVLRAYDASNLGKELYNSNQNGARDTLGEYVKFSVPVVANGKVYAGTQNSLVVYGLLPVKPAPVAIGAPPISQK
jgi:outer membrane protein assembly factor BamB